MKVHFGGSSMGLKKLKPEYLQIRKSLKKLHIKLIDDWLDPNQKNRDISSGEAYDMTVKAIGRADAVILESTFDTSSIGKQLILALDLELPILLLSYEEFHKDSNLDKFIDKKATKLVKKILYNNDNLIEKLKEFLTWADENTKIVRFNLELERRLDNHLKDLAKRNKTSKSEEIRRLILEELKGKGEK